MKSRSQTIATEAMSRVQAVQAEYPDKESKPRKEYGSMAHKLPMLIRTAGLSQALAFVRARGKEMHIRLLNDVAHSAGKADGSNLQEAAHDAENLADYMILTRDVLNALLWYKRFAESVLDVKATDAAEVPND